nr:hypothetical protein [Tanacetum cinerariifolium]
GPKRQKEGGEQASASTPSEKATEGAGKSTTGSQSRQMSASKSAFAEEPVQTTCQMEETPHPPRRPPSPDRAWNTTLPAAQGDAQSWISDLARQTDARSSFNELLDTPIDFSNFIMHRLNIDTLTPDLLAGPTYELMRWSCTSLTELEYHLEEPLPLMPDNRGPRVIPFEHFINNDLEYLRGESGEGDDEETKSDRESEEEETKEEEEESFHLIPRTSEDDEDDENGDEDQGLRISEEERIQEEEEADELYRDVDINQGRGLQVSQDIEDSHVTLTPVQPNGQQESSSVSSFVTSMLNPTSDAGVESIFTTSSSPIAPLPTTTHIMTPSTVATITTSSDAPIPPTTIPSTVLENLPTFDSVFRFEDKVKSLEVNFSEFMQTNQFADAVSKILGGTTTGSQSRQLSASESAFAEEPVQTTC